MRRELATRDVSKPTNTRREPGEGNRKTISVNEHSSEGGLGTVASPQECTGEGEARHLAVTNAFAIKTRKRGFSGAPSMGTGYKGASSPGVALRKTKRWQAPDDHTRHSVSLVKQEITEFFLKEGN